MKNKEIELLDSEDFKIDLMNQMEVDVGVDNLKSLAIGLHDGCIDEKKVSHAFEKVLKALYSKTDGFKRKADVRSNYLSRQFTSVMKDMGLIHDWYNH